MCCVVTDGGGALVLTTAERARDLPGGEHAVYLLGSGEAAEAPLMSQMDDIRLVRRVPTSQCRSVPHRGDRPR